MISNFDSRVQAVIRRHFELCQDTAAVKFDYLSFSVFHEMFESMLVINLGSQLKTLSSATVLYVDVFRPFFRLLSPDAAKQILHSFPKFAITLENGVNGAELDIQPVGIEHPLMFHAAYSEILCLELQMIQETSIGHYLAYIKSHSRRELVDLLDSGVNLPASEVVNVAAPERSPQWAVAQFLHGFLRQIGYHAQINLTLDGLDDPEYLSDITRFRERIRDIFSWRVDVRSVESVRKIETVRDFVISKAISEVPPAAQLKLKSELENVFNQAFGFPVPTGTPTPTPV